MNICKAIPVDKRVAVAFYKLCSPAEARRITQLFDMGRSTVNITYRVYCETAVASLEPQWVKMLTANDMENHIGESRAFTEFPQGVGALDGCHF